MLHPGALVAFGLLVGFLGTLVGIGGGFFMVPYFTQLAGLGHVPAAGTSLAAIVLNSASGTTRWAIQRRLDWLVGLGLGLATVPGTFLGQEVATRIDRRSFLVTFGLVVAAVAVYLLVARPSATDGRFALFRRGLRREFTDSFGATHSYEVNLRLGLLFSVLVGFVAALLGIGGGFAQVPFMVVVYGLPVHVATATSQLSLLVTSLAGAAVYAIRTGEVQWPVALWTGLGAAVGAQLAASVAPRVSAAGLKTALALVLLVVAAGMAVRGFM